MSVARCRAETTSTQFLDWCQYMRDDVNAFHRSDYMLARVAQTVARVLHPNPKQVQLEDFLVKFDTGTTKGKPAATPDQDPDLPLSDTAKAQRLARSKAAWLGVAGLLNKGRGQQPPKPLPPGVTSYDGPRKPSRTPSR